MIQLTTHKGPILVNPLNINYAKASEEGGTKLIFTDGSHLLINEKPADYLKLVREWDSQNG